MKRLRTWWRRVTGPVFAARRERELAAELESHFQLHVDDNLRAGMTPEEARRAAVLKFGPVEAAKEESGSTSPSRPRPTSWAHAPSSSSPRSHWRPAC